MAIVRCKIEVIRSKKTFKPILRVNGGKIYGFEHLAFNTRADTLRTCGRIAHEFVLGGSIGYAAMSGDEILAAMEGKADIVETISVEVETND